MRNSPNSLFAASYAQLHTTTERTGKDAPRPQWQDCAAWNVRLAGTASQWVTDAVHTLTTASVTQRGTYPN